MSIEQEISDLLWDITYRQMSGNGSPAAVTVTYDKLKQWLDEFKKLRTQLNDVEFELKLKEMEARDNLDWFIFAMNNREKVKKALEFYACADHYEGGEVPRLVANDKGAIARKVLERAGE